MKAIERVQEVGRSLQIYRVHSYQMYRTTINSCTQFQSRKENLKIKRCFMSFDCELQLELLNFNDRRGGKEGFIDWARRPSLAALQLPCRCYLG